MQSKNTVNNNNDNEISQLRDKKEKANDSLKYSTDRIDIVVITISTAAIAHTTNILSKLTNEVCDNFVYLIKISLSFFVISIIFNLLSQMTAFHHFRLKIERFDLLIKKEKKNEEIDESKIFELKSKMNTYNRITNFFNHSSTYSLILGIIFLLLYFLFKN